MFGLINFELLFIISNLELNVIMRVFKVLFFWILIWKWMDRGIFFEIVLEFENLVK